MPKPTEETEASEMARMTCDCNECGGLDADRKGGDCLRESIADAITDSIADAIKTKPRTPEWWATYNAAVTGLLASAAYSESAAGRLHEMASEQADVSTMGAS